MLCVLLCEGVFLLLGNFLDQQSSLFHEEFPQLAPGEEKGQVPKRVDENREVQRGPVLDPRHQGGLLFIVNIIWIVTHAKNVYTTKCSQGAPALNQH